MNLRSPLHEAHLAAGATMTEFAGYDMPVRYTSDIAEHQAVRTAAGLFDLSHMAEFVVRGAGASAGLDYATVGHISNIGLNQAKYTMLCDVKGGVIDDIVIYRRDLDEYMIVANASNRELVRFELEQRLADFDVTIADETDIIALIAVQGPLAEDIVAEITELGDDDVRALKYYSGANVMLEGGIHVYVARTGYTGEDGFEIFVTADNAVAVWDMVLAQGEGRGLIPCGLGARDTLRLEAGMPLYGHELDRDHTPVAAGLGRVVNITTQRQGEFVGRQALREQRAVRSAWDVARKRAPEDARVLVGLRGEGRRAARAEYAVKDDAGIAVGVVTSGAPSPTLGVQIAMAYVHPRVAEVGTVVAVDVRGRDEEFTVVALPFYQREK